MSISYITQEGYNKIKAELDMLKTKGRDEAAKAIAEAREKGDLSENAEYDAAKDAQGLLELKINNLEKTLANSRLIDSSQLDGSKVTILTNVTIKNMKPKTPPRDVATSNCNLDLHLEQPANHVLPDLLRGEHAAPTLEEIANHCLNHIKEDKLRLQQLQWFTRRRIKEGSLS